MQGFSCTAHIVFCYAASHGVHTPSNTQGPCAAAKSCDASPLHLVSVAIPSCPGLSTLTLFVAAPAACA
jgi:hypothetical protein